MAGINYRRGTLLRGYEIRELIGRGGFGAVYRAHQQVINRDVAIKVIEPEFANQPTFIRSFEIEAQLIARLEHINIVPLYDFWRDPDGAFLVMRFLSGGSLQARISQGPIVPDNVLRILEQLTDALHAAHRNGIVHRDIKPANIIFDNDGNAFLSDFGIAFDQTGEMHAKFADDASAEDEISGTPSYFAPEQAQGEKTGTSSDIYSLGIVTLEMLVGQLNVMSGKSIWETVRNQIIKPLPLVAEFTEALPLDLDIVLQRATAKKPTDRYDTAREFYQDLQRVLSPVASSKTSLQGLQVPQDDSVIQIETNPNGTLQGINPYKGLQAFSEADADTFFGREELVQQLLDRVQRHNFLAVVGPSGSGKSSVVRAGLLPALRSGAIDASANWFICDMLPGHNPFLELESALLSVAMQRPSGLMDELRRNNEGLKRAVERILPDDVPALVLVVDQFEELFTQVEDEATRTDFLDLLRTCALDKSGRLKIVVTMRADFFDKPLLYGGIGDLFRTNSEIVLPLNDEEMRDVIVKPAELAGVAVEPALVAAIISAVREQPGALPLLQYALTELFEQRTGKQLTYTLYEASGGVMGVLGSRAEEIYLHLNNRQRELVRQIFMRLVTLGDGTEDTRRRVDLSVLRSIGDSPEAVQDVLDIFGRFRLLTFDNDPQTRNPTVEVAHEALIREWQRLRRWLNTSRDELRLRQRLTASVVEWQQHNQSASFLVSGVRLKQFEELMNSTSVTLSTPEMAFLEASVAAQAEAEATERERQEKERLLERRANQRLRLIVGLLLIASIIGSGLLLLTLDSQAQAESERNSAIDARQTAEANAQLAIEAAAETDRQLLQTQVLALSTTAQQIAASGNTVLGLSMALESVRRVETPPEVSEITLRDLAFQPGLRAVIDAHEVPIGSLLISEDQRYLISAIGPPGFRRSSGTPIQQEQDQNRPGPGSSRANAGGLAIDSRPEGVPPRQQDSIPTHIRVWDLLTGENVLESDLFTGPVTDLETLGQLNTDSNERIIGGDEGGNIIIWEVDTGRELAQLSDAHEPGHILLSTSAHAPRLATTSLSVERQPTIVLWNTATLEEVTRFVAEPTLQEMALGPDGSYLIALLNDGTLLRYSLPEGEVVARLAPLSTDIREAQMQLQVAPDNLVVAFSYGGAKLFAVDPQLLSVVLEFEIEAGNIQDLALSRDVRGMVVGAQNGVFAGLRIDQPEELLLQDNEIETTRVTLSADGSIAVLGGTEGEIHIWDLRSNDDNTLAILPADELNRRVAFRPGSNGTQFITFTASGTQENIYNQQVTIVDWPSRRVINAFPIPNSNMPHRMTISQDGNYALLGHIRQLPTSASKGTKTNPGGPESTDGTSVILLDLRSGEIIRNITLPGVPSIEMLAFQPYSGERPLYAYVAHNRRVIEVDLHTGTVVRGIVDVAGAASRVLVTTDHDVQRIFTLTDTEGLQVWETATAELLATFPSPNHTINRLIASPDGTRLALTTTDTNIILIVDSTNGETLKTLVGHTDIIRSAVFFDDNRQLLSAGDDGTVLRWSLFDEETEPQRYETHRGRVWDIDVNAATGRFVSISDDRTAIIWAIESLTLDGLIEWVETNRYTRPLTTAECNLYNLAQVCTNLELIASAAEGSSDVASSP